VDFIKQNRIDNSAGRRYSSGHRKGRLKILSIYGEAHILRDVSLQVASGEILGLLGRNGAGKTTTLRAIMGVVRLAGGTHHARQRRASQLPAHEIPRRGIAYVPQGRRLFAELTGAQSARASRRTSRLASSSVAVAPRRSNPFWICFLCYASAGASARGRCPAGSSRCSPPPGIVLMDEPSEGLMPAPVDRLLSTITELQGRGVGLLLVEQKVDAVLRVADRVALIENGRIVRQVTPPEPELLLRHVGVRR
jgi:branched-chain amino acid transport system ATP-binding protein